MKLPYYIRELYYSAERYSMPSLEYSINNETKIGQ